MNAQELVPVYVTNDPTLASILVGALKDEGIRATVEGANQAGLAGVMDVRVIVRAEDADRAKHIINDHPQAPRDQHPHHDHGKHH
jgi:hypothetical protein